MKNAIDLLLRIDLYEAANLIGLNAPPTSPLITEQNLYSIINEVEVALLDGDREKEIASICGLLWTHFSTKFDNLAEYIYNVMAKIGFSPVSIMLAEKSQRKVSSSSLLSMIETTLHAQNESINIFNQEYRLTRFQKKLWLELESKKRVAISAPTSAGKSFLICLNLIFGAAKHKGISIYIVPTLTLMAQVVNDLIQLSRKHNQNISVETHLPSADTDFPKGKKATIYVLTQERLAEFSRFASSITNINYLIVDEVQNIERAFDVSNNDQRAKLLIDVVIDLHDQLSPRRTVISGPRISEISTLGERLFHQKCTPVSAQASPVTNICYSITPNKQDKNRLTLLQFSELQSKHLTLNSTNTIGAIGFGKSRYDDEFYNYLFRVIQKNDHCLIFSPTSSQARKTALKISAAKRQADNAERMDLASYIERTVLPGYDLSSCVKKSTVFHHGKMPHHVRNAVEHAISRGLIDTVVCTTTLMQGVNIPAKNVVMRNPNLFITKQDGQAPRLSAYEIANLRGRAGRLLRDFVGRTFILDGTSFSEVEDQQSLFQSPPKELDGSYTKVFENHRKDIINSLVKIDDQKRNSLTKYINNVLYTEANGPALLLRKGINLSDQELQQIKRVQSNLTVGREVCRKYRYWDPFELQKIYDNRNFLDVPSSTFTSDATDKLAKALTDISRILPDIAKNFLGKRTVGNQSKLWIVAKNAVLWANEVPLRTLLDTEYARTNPDQTESSIAMLQNTISYGLPALLSPLYSIKYPNSNILSAIERGAINPATVIQINHNIPRETAIFVTEKFKIYKQKITTIEDILKLLKTYKIDYWHAIQYRHLVDFNAITRSF